MTGLHYILTSGDMCIVILCAVVMGIFLLLRWTCYKDLAETHRESPTLAKTTPRTFSLCTVLVIWEQFLFMALESHPLTVMIDSQFSLW